MQVEHTALSTSWSLKFSFQKNPLDGSREFKNRIFEFER